jgi:L-ascorbate metabolism protein UlaG (beta-lactamase superfamily)
MGLVAAFALFTGIAAIGGCGGPLHVTAPSTTGLPAEVTVQSYPWYTRDHHAAGRFQNIHRGLYSPSFARVAWWILTKRVLGRPFRRGDRPIPARSLDPTTLVPRPDGLRATWVGHATLYLQTSELDLLLDPVFSRVAGPVPFAGPDRRVRLPIEMADLPRVDVVLISHDHYDHFEKRSVNRLAERFDPVFVVPLGLGSSVRTWGGRRVVELDWWQYVDLPARRAPAVPSALVPDAAGSAAEEIVYRIACTPAEHNSGRRIGAMNRTLWAGWHVTRYAIPDDAPRDAWARTALVPDSLAIFYGGDTGYGSHFAAIRHHLGTPELAILPIGAYEPRSMTEAVHMTPEEALRAFSDLGGGGVAPSGTPPHLLPVHWGTFELTDEPLHEPPVRLARAADRLGVADYVRVLAIGESYLWPPTWAPPVATEGTRAASAR